MFDFDRVTFWTDPASYSERYGHKFQLFTQPEFYLDKTGFTDIALSSFKKYVKKDWSFLELGCGSGRTLAAMTREGFTNVSGVEINQRAIDLGRKTFPELEHVSMVCSPIERIIDNLSDFDVIYTVGVFMHLPYELDWIFKVVSNKAQRMILTAENEVETDFFKWARNYKTIFENLGWKQVEHKNGVFFPPLPDTTIKRVFMKGKS